MASGFGGILLAAFCIGLPWPAWALVAVFAVVLPGCLDALLTGGLIAGFLATGFGAVLIGLADDLDLTGGLVEDLDLDLVFDLDLAMGVFRTFASK